jgi:hypothetical protein
MYQRAAIFILQNQTLTFSTKRINQPMSWSAAKKNRAAKTTMTSTIAVEIVVSRRDGQVIFDASERTCRKNVIGLVLDAIYCPRNYGA